MVQRGRAVIRLRSYALGDDGMEDVNFHPVGLFFGILPFLSFCQCLSFSVLFGC